MLLGYQKTFSEPVRTGEKDITFRKPRKRVPKWLEPVHEYTGLRTKVCRKLNTRQLENAFLVSIREGSLSPNADILFGTQRLDYTWDGFCDAILKRLPGESDETYEKNLRNAIARRDGFPDWETLYRWHRRQGNVYPTQMWLLKMGGGARD